MWDMGKQDMVWPPSAYQQGLERAQETGAADCFSETESVGADLRVRPKKIKFNLLGFIPEFCTGYQSSRDGFHPLSPYGYVGTGTRLYIKIKE